MVEKAKFKKDKINDVVDFMCQHEYKLIYYKIVHDEDDMYTIDFFSLNKKDSVHMHMAINVNFGVST